MVCAMLPDQQSRHLSSDFALSYSTKWCLLNISQYSIALIQNTGTAESLKVLWLIIATCSPTLSALIGTGFPKPLLVCPSSCLI